MSLIWNDLDKENMRNTQESLMMDEGYKLIYSRTIDTFGDESETYTQDSESTICGFEMLSGNEAHGSNMTVVTYEAIIRLPYDYSINEKDKFKITKFRGETVDWTFKIATPIQKGVSGLRINVNRVEV